MCISTEFQIHNIKYSSYCMCKKNAQQELDMYFEDKNLKGEGEQERMTVHI